MNTPAPTPLALHAHVTGQGEPVVVIHGLFGNWQNLNSSIRAMAETFEVHALDVRNHGKSPHSDIHNYDAMAADIAHYMDEHMPDGCRLLGHSMGGKACMWLALHRPDLIKRMIIVDIAPRAYGRRHDDMLNGLKDIEGKTFKNRREVDTMLNASVEDISIRSFLMKNLVLTEGVASWRMNRASIEKNYMEIAGWPGTKNVYPNPVLFIKGELSKYILSEDRDEILERFPATELKLIHATGHWPHADKGTVFNKLVMSFFTRA